jgi:hypothetical protein
MPQPPAHFQVIGSPAEVKLVDLLALQKFRAMKSQPPQLVLQLRWMKK